MHDGVRGQFPNNTRLHGLAGAPSSSRSGQDAARVGEFRGADGIRKTLCWLPEKAPSLKELTKSVEVFLTDLFKGIRAGVRFSDISTLSPEKQQHKAQEWSKSFRMSNDFFTDKKSIDEKWASFHAQGLENLTSQFARSASSAGPLMGASEDRQILCNKHGTAALAVIQEGPNNLTFLTGTHTTGVPPVDLGISNKAAAFRQNLDNMADILGLRAEPYRELARWLDGMLNSPEMQQKLGELNEAGGSITLPGHSRSGAFAQMSAIIVKAHLESKGFSNVNVKCHAFNSKPLGAFSQQMALAALEKYAQGDSLLNFVNKHKLIDQISVKQDFLTMSFRSLRNRIVSFFRGADLQRASHIAVPQNLGAGYVLPPSDDINAGFLDLRKSLAAHKGSGVLGALDRLSNRDQP